MISRETFNKIMVIKSVVLLITGVILFFFDEVALGGGAIAASLLTDITFRTNK